ncbi:hypothetical protein [Paludisphaera rhizosphaerae]|uniref:hypothetical protein n=1 Tax=Paludisphaera rhizosphaerae TaxID=2711216 RepID=UPI0013EE356B|nr:hypothetical protein [Paludisphaera rhizosphaerae]
MADTIITPNEGELQLLSDLLTGGTLENWSLRLFTNAVTVTEASTLTDFTIATFTGYTSATLTRGSWGTPASGTPSGSWSAEASVAEASYAEQTFTNSSASPVAIKGYIIVGATSGKVIRACRFETDQTINASGGTLKITPKCGLA